MNLRQKMTIFRKALDMFFHIGTQDHNRRYKLILGIGLSKRFAPTRLIISIFHRLIGQYFDSGILFISLANLHGGKR